MTTLTVTYGTAVADISKANPSGIVVHSADGQIQATSNGTDYRLKFGAINRIVINADESKIVSQDNGTAYLTVSNDGVGAAMSGYTRMLLTVAESSTFSPNGAKQLQLTNTAVNGSFPYTNLSDRRLKTEMTSIPDSLLDVWADHVKWGCYQMLEDGVDGARYIGIYAQDIIDAFDAAGIDHKQWGIVSTITRSDGSEHYGVSYNDVMAIEHALLRRAVGIQNKLPKTSILSKIRGLFT